ncbi:hypothetical protein SEA_BIPPER_133 [Mycobacterium phage Bipper]|uniref:Uncharacterized protein n=1 Tax=Mycobacterium phage Bipper TaxID=1805457 RepID=A0A142F2R1_9CAUD|nr:hypothetical protein KCH39_gp044 [Mycobacterium phage Bipper]AMQ67068.1 hypothetical protein SEA_BIPPER_133 [Mycobacterium phage Bipper]
MNTDPTTPGAAADPAGDAADAEQPHCVECPHRRHFGSCPTTGCDCGPLDGPGVIASLEANPLGTTVLHGPHTSVAEERGEELVPARYSFNTDEAQLAVAAITFTGSVADGLIRHPVHANVEHVLTSHQFAYHDVPGHPGWKEARPVANDKTHQIDIRVDGKIVYSQHLAEYHLSANRESVELTGSIKPLEAVEVTDNPLLPPTGTPVTLPEGFVPITDESTAPDAHLNEEPESQPIIETVHTGARDVAAEEEQRKADRAARRKAQADKAPGYGEAATSAAQGDENAEVG